MSVCEELAGAGWVDVHSPPPRADPSVVAMWNGRPVKAGVEVEREDSGDRIYTRYSTGPYYVDLDIDLENARLRVEKR